MRLSEEFRSWQDDLCKAITRGYRHFTECSIAIRFHFGQRNLYSARCPV